MPSYVFLFLTAKSKRAETGKSKLIPVPGEVGEKVSTTPERLSDEESAEGSDYDTDLEDEQPREEYDPTGTRQA